jgi:hypothetical protein
MKERQPEGTFRIYDLLFVIHGWIRKVADTGKLCQTCENDPACFTFESYGYEGIKSDVESIEALLDNETATIETAVKSFNHMFRKYYETQSRGIYQVVGKTYLCDRCLADMADAHIARNDTGVLTVNELVSSLGTTSCLIGWQVLSVNEIQRIPVLLYTQAQTIDDVLQFVKSPDVFLKKKEIH